MKYLIDQRIIYRRLPIKDEPSEVYDWGWFYKEGTHEYYNLFNSPAKITTYKSLKWHLIVLWYLNQDLDYEQFKKIVLHITDFKNNFITFRVKQELLNKVIDEVHGVELDLAPNNKIKKVIFKDFIPLTKNEKLSIVGKLLGRGTKASPESIYDCMLEINDLGEKITISKLAKYLNCTTRTVHRNMTDDLNLEKYRLNEEVQCKKLRTA
jgi:hypothetical protein